MAHNYNRKVRKRYVTSNGNEITISSLRSRYAVKQLIGILNYNNRIKEWTIETGNTDSAFPNAVVPIAGILSHLSQRGYRFNVNGKLAAILTAADYTGHKGRSIMHHVWRFTKESIGTLVKEFMTELQKSDQFHKGTLEVLEWSINEVMDNAVRHSKMEEAFVMGEIHQTTKQLAFAIFDNGQGIYNSFRMSKESRHNPRSHVDAISIAMQEEVTSRPSDGQGNGLFGLHSIIRQGKGSLTITSGNGMIYLNEEGKTTTANDFPVLQTGGQSTSVDFQLNYDKELSLDTALKFRGKIHELVYLNFEELEDDLGNVLYKISERADGTGTRDAAVRCKNEILNILNNGPKRIILDFTGVSMMSSSFADELIAKLFVELGLFQFNNLIIIKGLDSLQQNILQRSVLQRIVEITKPSSQTKSTKR